MRGHRTRWALIICTAAFAVGVFAVLVANRYYTAMYQFGTGDQLEVYTGAISYFRPAPSKRGNFLPAARGWHFNPQHRNTVLWKPRFRSDAIGWSVQLPLWIPGILAAGASGWLWYRTPQRVGLCKNCGYDLSGAISAVCPECGEAL